MRTCRASFRYTRDGDRLSSLPEPSLMTIWSHSHSEWPERGAPIPDHSNYSRAYADCSRAAFPQVVHVLWETSTSCSRSSSSADLQTSLKDRGSSVSTRVPLQSAKSVDDDCGWRRGHYVGPIPWALPPVGSIASAEIATHEIGYSVPPGWSRTFTGCPWRSSLVQS